MVVIGLLNYNKRVTFVYRFLTVFKQFPSHCHKRDCGRSESSPYAYNRYAKQPNPNNIPAAESITACGPHAKQPVCPVANVQSCCKLSRPIQHYYQISQLHSFPQIKLPLQNTFNNPSNKKGYKRPAPHDKKSA